MKPEKGKLYWAMHPDHKLGRQLAKARCVATSERGGILDFGDTQLWDVWEGLSKSVYCEATDSWWRRLWRWFWTWTYPPDDWHAQCQTKVISRKLADLCPYGGNCPWNLPSTKHDLDGVDTYL